MPSISENNKGQFSLKLFNELTTEELYAILQLREAVFQLEQNCLYTDIDNKDQQAYHLLYWYNKELLAYARLLPKNISYSNAVSFGRLCTAKAFRKKQIGHLLMNKIMLQLNELFPNELIKISAQTYLVPFYGKYGFKTVGNAYLEDGLPHIEMQKK